MQVVEHAGHVVDDTAYVVALERHEPRAWRHFLREYRRHCARIAAHYGLAHEHDDLFSEFLLKMLGHPPEHAGALRQYRPGVALLPFLTAVMHHVALDRLRRIKARIAMADVATSPECCNGFACPHGGAEPAPTSAELDVLDAVEHLPEDERRLVALHYHHGFTVRELAEIVGISKTNVALHLQRIHATLRRTMIEHGWTKPATDA